MEGQLSKYASGRGRHAVARENRRYRRRPWVYNAKKICAAMRLIKRSTSTAVLGVSQQLAGPR